MAVIRFAIRVLLCVLCGSAVNLSVAGDWPCWRGPHLNGVSDEKDLPVQFSATQNVKWKAPLFGAGVSQPVVWGDRIILTASDSREHDRLHVLCYHRGDGKQLWHTKFFGSVANPQSMFPPGGMAVPTPVTDGQHVWTLFGTGDLFCLDLHGKPVWIRSLAQECGPFMNRWGMGSSPILVNDILVVQVDHWAQSYLLGVDAKTGVTRWKAERDASVNWSTPIIAVVQGKPQLIVLGTFRAKGYEPNTGEELWTVGGMQFQCIPSPTIAGNLLFAVSGRKGNTLAIRLDGSRGDLTGTHVLWKNHRGAPYVPSPVAVGDLYFLVDDQGIATCLNAKNGEVHWQQRLGGQFRASLLAADGKVYYTSMEGVITVIKAAATFERLSKNEMGENIVASPAVSNGQLFIRGEKHLFCVDVKK